VVDNAAVAAETKAYRPIPVINRFRDADGNDIMQQQIQRNYDKIKADVMDIVEDELQRIKSDPKLQQLLGTNNEKEA
ncbi:MAG: conjugal transfer protein TraG, partial [Alistipes sp.]|nr:conjugal transfer protein TraG [Alistipes sp.]